MPLNGVLVTADAMQTTRDNARFLRQVQRAHFLWPVLGNQPGRYAALDALDWDSTPVAAATVDTARGRIETRTICVLPVPEGADFPGAKQALLIERYVTVKKNGQWVMRNCEVILYITSLAPRDDTPTGPARALIRTGNAPQVWSAVTNLVITLFRIQGVTSYTGETRRNAQDPRRALHLLDLSPG